MNTENLQLVNYRKFLLNRITVSPIVVSYIDNCLAIDDEAANHSFHKIMVHNWTEDDIQLFDTLTKYFSTVFVPVNYVSLGEITTFYTSNLNLILKLIKHDFMFPFRRNMVNVDILFNDRNSVDCFDIKVTVEDIVSGVVSCRFNEKCELDLSNFCKDPEFIDKKINFYKLSLLSYFKSLMIRMGRDTKVLNLSNNNISQVPVDILNFFIKGDLIAVNLSNNNIPSIAELLRISSKIEKLWVEGNPLCDQLDPTSYVKQIVIKFPRLTELDGIKLNQCGIMFPFFKNYIDTPNRKTKMLVEKFLTLYFTHYDSVPRKSIDKFYETTAKLSISTNVLDSVKKSMSHIANYSRNFLNSKRKKPTRTYKTRDAIVGVLSQFPASVHDPASFTVDVLKHDRRTMILVVDGLYKEKRKSSERVFQFRRTFVFNIYTVNTNSIYHIENEMFSISFASEEQIQNNFQIPIRNMNSLVLINPEPEECDAITKAFLQLTQLKRSEVEKRLKAHNWDIRKALSEFIYDIKNNKISQDKLVGDEYEDLSDLSSLMDDID